MHGDEVVRGQVDARPDLAPGLGNGPEPLQRARVDLVPKPARWDRQFETKKTGTRANSGYDGLYPTSYHTQRSTFQVNKRDHKIFTEDKRNLEARLDRTNFPHEPGPLFQESNITYEIAERTRAIGYGGIGAIHKLSCRLGLNRAIDRKIELLKLHAPYHESDHVLNIAYAFGWHLPGGHRTASER